MGVEYKDVIRLETTAALMPTTVKSGQLGFATDDNKLGRLWLDGVTLTWHTPDGGHPWFSDCDIGEYLNHYQDTDTFLRFQTDRITLNAGGVNFLDCNESTADLMTLGNGAMKIDVDNFKVGIGSAITTPDYDLEVHQGGNYTESLLIVDSDNAVVKIGGLSPTEGDDGQLIVRDRVGTAYFDVDVYGGKTTNASTMIVATQSLTQFGVGTATPATGTKMELSNTVGQDPEDFLLITGSTADNAHYSGISFKAGTLANVYPSFQVDNGGLALIINSGSHSSSYTKTVHAAFNAAATEAGAFFKIYNQDGDNIVQALGDGKVGLGMTPTYQLQLSTDSAAKPSTTTWTVPSDKRMKKEIKPFSKYGLKELLSLKPVEFKYNGKYNSIDDGKKQVGYLAQDIKKVMPEMVSSIEIDGEEILNVNSHLISFAVIEAIRELNDKIEKLSK